jgi:hypothetical protein
MCQSWTVAKAPPAINSGIPIPITRHCGLNTTVGSAGTKFAYWPVVPETILAQRPSNSLAIASRPPMLQTPKIELGLRWVSVAVPPAFSVTQKRNGASMPDGTLAFNMRTAESLK